jgi:predicted nuclease of restriction endonuclease-like RecB superfamily
LKPASAPLADNAALVTPSQAIGRLQMAVGMCNDRRQREDGFILNQIDEIETTATDQHVRVIIKVVETSRLVLTASEQEAAIDAQSKLSRAQASGAAKLQLALQSEAKHPRKTTVAATLTLSTDMPGDFAVGVGQQ